MIIAIDLDLKDQFKQTNKQSLIGKPEEARAQTNDSWCQLFKINDVVSSRFVTISNGNITNTLLFYSVFAFEVDI